MRATDHKMCVYTGGGAACIFATTATLLASRFDYAFILSTPIRRTHSFGFIQNRKIQKKNRNMTSHIFLNPNFDVIHRKSLNSLRPSSSENSCLKQSRGKVIIPIWFQIVRSNSAEEDWYRYRFMFEAIQKENSSTAFKAGLQIAYFMR